MSILGAIGGVAGSVIDAIAGNSAAEDQAAMQMAFATHGVRWKVKDAKKAGIHPLYALGANTVSYQPVSVGSTDFANAGQNLGSAIDAMRTPREKTDAFEKTVQDLTLQKMGLENEVLASQLRMVNQPGRGPGMPVARSIDGQGQTNELTAGGGVTIQVNPVNSPAQDWENQYGEIGGELAGIGNLINDVDRKMKANPVDPVLLRAIQRTLANPGRGNLNVQSRRKPAPQYPRY